MNLVLRVIPWRIGAISWKLIRKRGYRVFGYLYNRNLSEGPDERKPFSRIDQGFLRAERLVHLASHLSSEQQSDKTP